MAPSVGEPFDLAVVGGGPAGSTLAALVATRGHRVILLEKERFPRYQIGESLLPSTIHGIGRMLGVADTLSEAGFTRKLGGTFRWGSSPEPWTFSFAVSPKLAGPTSHAYQVERMRFDQILLDNARRLGVQVREDCLVTGVVADGERVRGLRYADPQRSTHEIAARFVADASGNRSRTYQHTGGERVYSEFFRHLAVFGYFTGGKRLPEPRSGNILSAAFDDGWFWYIPLTQSLTSVGAVVTRDRADQIQNGAAEALHHLIDRCPLIREMLADARRVTDGPYGEVRVRKDYSYSNTRFWCPGMVLVGDAACFVDPVFSSGVHLATYSALLAARSINSVLAGDLDEQRSFAEFEARYRREYNLFYEFLMAFYDLHSDERSYFWTAKKVTRSSGGDVEAFVDLVGGLASGDRALVEPAPAGERLATAAGDLAEAVRRATASGDGYPVVPLFGSAIVNDVMRESVEIQARAFLGPDAGDEVPLFPGGLVSSSDGLSWCGPVNSE